jgi:hypothetical protein
MDIPYKGYTIIPNSERQPDGRWLPVADLHADDRGVGTPRPPLRAAAREVRATRADADTVAVKMAKAWIETTEREGALGVPVTRATPAPRDSPPPRARAVEARKRPAPAPVPIPTPAPAPAPAPADPLTWPGLDDADRFTRLLAVHSLLDRLVTLALAARLAPGGESVFDDMASMPFATRVALAASLNVVPRAAAESILEIDRARNRLVHSKPMPGKPAWSIGAAVERLPQDAHDRSVRKALETAQALIATVKAAAQG